MLGFEIADCRRSNRIPCLEPLDDHVLLRVMARIRIVLEVVDDGEDDFVIWTISAIEHSQLAFKDSKQPFNIAMLLTQNLDHVSHDAPTVTSESVAGCKRVLYT